MTELSAKNPLRVAKMQEAETLVFIRNKTEPFQDATVLQPALSTQ